MKQEEGTERKRETPEEENVRTKSEKEREEFEHDTTRPLYLRQLQRVDDPSDLVHLLVQVLSRPSASSSRGVVERRRRSSPAVPREAS